MRQKCKECKNWVEIPEGFEIQACLINDHWFRPIVENNADEIIDYNFDKRDIIKINSNPLLKMYYYTKAAKGEVSGFGKVRVENDCFVVTDVMIFKQRCSGGYTEMNRESLATFIYELSKRNEDPNEWNLWWHSHGSMSVFFSGIDKNTIQELSNGTTLLSICVNKDGEMLGRVDKDGVSSRVNVVVVPRKVGRLWRRCKKEVRRKVGEMSWKEVNEDEQEPTTSIDR